MVKPEDLKVGTRFTLGIETELTERPAVWTVVTDSDKEEGTKDYLTTWDKQPAVCAAHPDYEHGAYGLVMLSEIGEILPD